MTEKLKGLTKGGWHPPGDREIHRPHRDTWKSDLKTMATGKKADPYPNSINHKSTPLNTLKDPESFGPPPKHSAVYGPDSNFHPPTPTAPAAPPRIQQPPSPGGLGAAQPRRPAAPAAPAVQEEQAPPTPYRTDTTGLRTDHLPKPPVKRADGAPAPALPVRSPEPAGPSLPPRRQQPAAPPPAPSPALPPRMNEFPDEHTPAPPPPYQEATKPARQNPAVLNAGALNRLSQAGVSVPGFGIGGSSSSTASQPQPAQQSQLSELQQRFARMNAGNVNQASPPQSPTTAIDTLQAAAHKKPPPPPPPKKPGLGNASGSRPGTSDGNNAPPPLPLGSKPRPTQ